MAFNWIEYLDQAHFLAGQHEANFSEEAAFRSAVSRAYYAVFCYSRNYARDSQDFVPSYKSEDHWKLRRHFRRRGRTSVASNLDDLQQWRKSCDYDDEVENIDQLLKDSLENAQEVIDRLT